MSGARSGLKVTASDALEFEAVQTEPPKRRRGLKVLLWGLVVCVLLGGGWIAYGERLLQLASGDTGNVPLVPAAAGPVKVRPENPGGLQVPNRDKLVYERIQSGSSRAEPDLVERLLPAPEKPLPKPLPAALAPATPAADAVGLRSPAVPVPPAPLPKARVPAVKDVTAVAPPPPPPPPPSAAATARAPIRLSKNGAPLKLRKQAVRAPAVASVNTPVPAKPVAAAPRTPSRTQVAAVNTTPPAPGKAAYRVQLAAARTPERAQSEWDRMRRKNLDLLGDLGLTVTKADLGPKKGVFYRLRVGPLANEAQARTLCKELSKRKMGCLVVKPGR